MELINKKDYETARALIYDYTYFFHKYSEEEPPCMSSVTTADNYGASLLQLPDGTFGLFVDKITKGDKYTDWSINTVGEPIKVLNGKELLDMDFQQYNALMESGIKYSREVFGND